MFSCEAPQWRKVVPFSLKNKQKKNNTQKTPWSCSCWSACDRPRPLGGFLLVTRAGTDRQVERETVTSPHETETPRTLCRVTKVHPKIQERKERMYFCEEAVLSHMRKP